MASPAPAATRGFAGVARCFSPLGNEIHSTADKIDVAADATPE